jgi:hypothetical protein
MSSTVDATPETEPETAAEAAVEATGPAYCGQCGQPLAEGAHEACAARLELEPPRYCGQCARRMVVQVLPGGWTARCSQHGTVGGPAV